MYTNSAATGDFIRNKKDTSRQLIITSCGTYHLHTKPKLPTYRPRGRIDWQLIYIAQGKAYFHFDSPENETIVTAGHMVIFRPKELQKYEYYGEDKPEVFWVHFTGNNVKNLLHKYDIPFEEHIFYTGISPNYPWIFHQMIQELQMKRPGHEEMTTILLCQLLIHINRQLQESTRFRTIIPPMIETARHYFSDHYSEDISIDAYAASIGVSASWFISQYKEYTGSTPMHYILSLRIAGAQNLLENTGNNISEIASLVGYDNPLYFSRLFKKQTGCSPSLYRKRKQEELSSPL